MATKFGMAMVAVVAGTLLLPAWALGHEAGDRARGVVERLDESSIQVKTSDGHAVTFAVTESTRFLRGTVDAKRTDVKLGAAPREHAPH